MNRGHTWAQLRAVVAALFPLAMVVPGGGALSGVALEPDGTHSIEWCEASGVKLYSRA